jgi:hypothetical protein
MRYTGIHGMFTNRFTTVVNLNIVHTRDAYSIHIAVCLVGNCSIWVILRNNSSDNVVHVCMHEYTVYTLSLRPSLLTADFISSVSKSVVVHSKALLLLLLLLLLLSDLCFVTTVAVVLLCDCGSFGLNMPNQYRYFTVSTGFRFATIYCMYDKQCKDSISLVLELYNVAHKCVQLLR